MVAEEVMTGKGGRREPGSTGRPSRCLEGVEAGRQVFPARFSILCRKQAGETLEQKGYRSSARVLLVGRKSF